MIRASSVMTRDMACQSLPGKLVSSAHGLMIRLCVASHLG